MSDAVDAYLDDCRRRELRPSTLASTGYRLRSLLGLEAGRTGGLLADLTPARARRLVDAMEARTLSVTYRRGALAEAGTWARWCANRGWLRADPFAACKVEGRAKRGKVQLSIDHARLFADRALELAQGGDGAALAVLLTLLLGCRASEVTDRLVGDVDDGGAVLWIRAAKTDAGRRRLSVPDHVRPLLVAACLDATGRRRPVAEPVFEPDRETPAGRHWLRYHVRRLCSAAGVPSVCPQSLRGLHATLATAEARTSHDVARALGHASPTVTERHYTTSEATTAAAQGRVLRVLAGGRR